MTYDDQRYYGKARMAGFDNLDEWAEAPEEAADILELANAADDEERSRVISAQSQRANDRIFQRAKIYGVIK